MQRRWLYAIAAAGIAFAAIAIDQRGNAPGALSEGHTSANIGCVTCHGVDRSPGRQRSNLCVSCHGEHPSSRERHRALQRDGTLACADCHAAHEPGLVASVAVRSVPLLGRDRCAGCHSVDKVTDPATRCFDPFKKESPSVCFDEHGMGRAHVWSRIDVSTSTALPVPSSDRGKRAPLSAAAAAIATALGFATWRRRKRRSNVGESPVNPVPKTPVRSAFARALPVIDQTTCLGCHACVDACAFDVLEVRSFVAHVARPEACCGAVTCAEVCPNGSLVVREQGEPADLLPLTDDGESVHVPGVFVAGDLSGLPLIKNAVAQGSRTIESIAKRVGARPKVNGDADVAIVGAGPAGLSAALRAKELGLTCIVYEQATVASTIQEFPREKLVFEQPLRMPKQGPLWFQECTKEELIREWSRIVRQERLVVREHERVVGLVREGERFHISSRRGDGALLVARVSHVVLAIGRRGSPRRLDVKIAPGEEHRVSYGLSDAAAYLGKRVLVVGLGDAALEAIQALARQPGTLVVVSYRGASFAKGSARNIEAVQALVAAKRVRIVWESALECVERARVVLKAPEGLQALPCDAVLALLGGVAPRGWFAEIGVWPAK